MESSSKTTFFFASRILIAINLLLGSAGGAAAPGLLDDDAGEGLVENVLEPVGGQRGALHVGELAGLDLDRRLVLGVREAVVLAVLLGERLLPLLGELLEGVLVLAEVHLRPDEHDRGVGAVVLQLDQPARAHVLERRVVDHRVAQQEDVRLRIGKCSDTSISFLSRSIPKREFDFFSFNHDCCFIIIEYSWDIFFRETAFCI